MDNEIRRYEFERRLERSFCGELHVVYSVPQNTGQRTDERGGTIKTRSVRSDHDIVSLSGAQKIAIGNLKNVCRRFGFTNKKRNKNKKNQRQLLLQ